MIWPVASTGATHQELARGFRRRRSPIAGGGSTFRPKRASRPLRDEYGWRALWADALGFGFWDCPKSLLSDGRSLSHAVSALWRDRKLTTWRNSARKLE